MSCWAIIVVVNNIYITTTIILHPRKIINNNNTSNIANLAKLKLHDDGNIFLGYVDDDDFCILNAAVVVFYL
jgi:hypothetical protein